MLATAAASMQLRIWPASLPPPVASNAMVAPVAVSAAVRSFINVSAVEFTMYLAPRSRRILSCSGLRNIDQVDTIGDAHPVQHLPQVGGGSGVYQRLVPSLRMVSHHAQGGERIDKQDAPSAAVVPSSQRQALIDTEAAILGVHLAAHHTDGPPSNAWRPRNCQRQSPRRRPHCRPGGIRPAARTQGASRRREYPRSVRALRCPGCAEGGGVGRPHQQGEVRGLIGVASIRTSTSSGRGRKLHATSEISRVLSSLTRNAVKAGCCHSKASISMNWPAASALPRVLLSPRRQPMSLQNKRRKDKRMPAAGSQPVPPITRRAWRAGASKLIMPGSRPDSRLLAPMSVFSKGKRPAGREGSARPPYQETALAAQPPAGVELELSYRLIKRLFNPLVLGASNIPERPCLFVGNHSRCSPWTAGSSGR